VHALLQSKSGRANLTIYRAAAVQECRPEFQAELASHGRHLPAEELREELRQPRLSLRRRTEKN